MLHREWNCGQVHEREIGEQRMCIQLAETAGK